jgi:pyruvate kinase
MTRHESTRRKVSLYRGVYPVKFDLKSDHHIEVNNEVVSELLSRGTVKDGDIIIITMGDLAGVHGGTNTMKIVGIKAP